MSSTWRPETVGVVLHHLVARRHAAHVGVAAGPGVLGRLGVLGPALHDPAEVELRVPDRAHLPVDQRGEPRRRAVLEHHVGELVVAVHEPGDEVDRLVGAQPRRRLVEAGQLPALDALEERGPPVDLAFVEAVGTTEVLQALGLPVDVAEQRDALDELVARAPCGLRGRCRTAPASRRCSSATSRRPSPSGRRCGRAPTGPRTRRWPRCAAPRCRRAPR